jgi:hypothetical protein
MPLPNPQVSDALVPAYCEVCGEEVTGLRSCDDLPIGYRYRVFTLYDGICEQCRGEDAALQRD